MSRTTSRLTLPLLTAFLVAVPLASCAGSDDLANLAQTWTLQTVHDSTLPYTVPSASHDIMINSAIATLRADNTYIVSFTGTRDGVAGSVGSDAGDWSITSSTFTFHSAPLNTDYIAALVGSTFRATIPGAMVSSSVQDFSMVFAKNP